MKTYSMAKQFSVADAYKCFGGKNKADENTTCGYEVITGVMNGKIDTDKFNLYCFQAAVNSNTAKAKSRSNDYCVLIPDVEEYSEVSTECNTKSDYNLEEDVINTVTGLQILDLMKNDKRYKEVYEILNILLNKIDRDEIDDVYDFYFNELVLLLEKDTDMQEKVSYLLESGVMCY